jgi:hypothetical protein
LQIADFIPQTPLSAQRLLYKKSSLFNLRHGLNRYLSNTSSIDIIHDADFKSSNRTFNATMKDLKRNDIGSIEHDIHENIIVNIKITKVFFKSSSSIGG